MSDGTPEFEARLRAFLTLRLLTGVGDRRVAELLERFGTPEAALSAPRKRFAAVVGARAAAERNRPHIGLDVDATLHRIEKLKLTSLVLGCDGYPGALMDLYDPPPLLFCHGDRALLERRAVAIVGARKASGYGRRVAETLAEALGARGIVVVSGLALGVDAAAHRGGLDSGGGTIAVMGSGLDRPYPPSNRPLFRRIAREGLLVSEFLPGDDPLRHHFPRRNRIIAALSRGVVVVEAGQRSGALITVDHATDLGREVFALPGSVESGKSAGSHALIRDGAHLVTDVEDILSELGWLADDRDAGGGDAVASGAVTSADAPLELGPDAQLLWEEMADGPAHLDDLLDRCGLSAPRVLAALSLLELAGRAVQQPGRRFARPSSGGTFRDTANG